MNHLKAIIAIVTLFLVQATCAAADGRIVPAGWEPSLDSIEETLSMEGSRPQQELNRASQQLADLRDAQLFIFYFRLLDALDDSRRSALLREQNQWLKTRETKARDAVQSKGGSLEPLEYSSAFREMTEQRMKQLTERLAALKQKRTNQKKTKK